MKLAWLQKELECGLDLSKDTERSVCMMLACSQKYQNVRTIVNKHSIHRFIASRSWLLSVLYKLDRNKIILMNFKSLDNNPID